MLGESGKRVYERREVGGKKMAKEEIQEHLEIERSFCEKYELVGFVDCRMAFVEGL